MNPFIIEQKRLELLSILPSISGRNKLWLLFEFYSALVDSNNKGIIESYYDEFIDEFNTELTNYNAFYLVPEESEKLLSLISQLSYFTDNEIIKTRFSKNISTINDHLNTLKSILDGKKVSSIKDISFPLIESYGSADNTKTFGILESVRIKISKAKDKNTFIFVPSRQKIDEQLKSQAEISFNIALEFLKKQKHRFNTYHEVLIYFENKTANYEGSSLGIALTIGFIQELTNFYNLPFLVYIKENITSTGGLDVNGKVQTIPKEIVQQKVETVFFSQIESFVIPKQDESFAQEKLDRLQEKYPQRNLKLIPIQDFQELLDRRNLIEIKKQSLIIRSAKGIKRNWQASVLFLFLILLSTFFFIYEYDDNPVIYELQANHILFKNKSGKLLWEKIIEIHPSYFPATGELNQFVKLLDINDDGKNEVLLCREIFSLEKMKEDQGSVICYDNTGNKIWKFKFTDTVETIIEKFDGNFLTRIIDTLHENGRKVLYLFANYDLLYPSVIYKVDLLTGKRLPGELRNPGAIYSALIKRNEKSKEAEIIVGCANNALKLPCIFSVSTNKLFGTNYSKPEYQFIGKQSSDLNKCLFLPKTDYSVYKKQYINQFTPGSLEDKVDEKLFSFNIKEGEIYEGAELVYKLNYDFSDVEIIVNSHLRVRRDALVAQRILKEPITDTKAYTDLLKSQILSWDGKELKPVFTLK